MREHKVSLITFCGVVRQSFSNAYIIPRTYMSYPNELSIPIPPESQWTGHVRTDLAPALTIKALEALASCEVDDSNDRSVVEPTSSWPFAVVGAVYCQKLAFKGGVPRLSVVRQFHSKYLRWVWETHIPETPLLALSDKGRQYVCGPPACPWRSSVVSPYRPPSLPSPSQSRGTTRPAWLTRLLMQPIASLPPSEPRPRPACDTAIGEGRERAGRHVHGPRSMSLGSNI